MAIAGTAEKMAAKIETWMKDNAPWQDGPAMWMPSQKGGYYYKQAGNARKRLYAIAFLNSGPDRYINKMTIDDAVRANEKALKDLNKQRRKAEKKPLKRLPVNMRMKVPTLAELYGQPTVNIRFGHGDPEYVPYGVYLELANGGQYAIVAPARDYWVPRIRAGIQLAINKGVPGVEFGIDPRKKGELFKPQKKSSRGPRRTIRRGRPFTPLPAPEGGKGQKRYAP